MNEKDSLKKLEKWWKSYHSRAQSAWLFGEMMLIWEGNKLG